MERERRLRSSSYSKDSYVDFRTRGDIRIDIPPSFLPYRRIGHDEVWVPILSRKNGNVRPDSSARRGGPPAKRGPSPEGLGIDRHFPEKRT